METKKEIRARLLKQREELSREDCERWSRAAAEKLFGHPRYVACRRLFSYMSFRNEVDTRRILEQALKEGRQTAVPKVEGRAMSFYEISSLSELVPGTWGILEPVGDPAGRIIPQRGDLMLLPGAAFDREGRRIGYGGGYYDRYLAAHPEAYTIALAYPFQVLGQLPAETYDRRADEVLTADG